MRETRKAGTWSDGRGAAGKVAQGAKGWDETQENAEKDRFGTRNTVPNRRRERDGFRRVKGVWSLAARVKPRPESKAKSSRKILGDLSRRVIPDGLRKPPGKGKLRSSRGITTRYPIM